MKSRAALVILENSHLALIRRIRDNKTYYVFPGGGIETDESPEQAAQREAMEELGVQVEIGSLLFEMTSPVQEQYFSATITGGQFGTGTGDEFSDPERGRGSYEAVWVPIDSLFAITVYPQALATTILQDNAFKPVVDQK